MTVKYRRPDQKEFHLLMDQIDKIINGIGYGTFDARVLTNPSTFIHNLYIRFGKYVDSIEDVNESSELENIKEILPKEFEVVEGHFIRDLKTDSCDLMFAVKIKHIIPIERTQFLDIGSDQKPT